MSKSKIDSFSGNYDFLSNFYPVVVELDGVKYTSVEHAYQAAKTLDLEEREVFRDSPTPAIAKKLGKKVQIREDWEEVKIEIMTNLVWQKFNDYEDLGKKLIDTRNAELVEGNWWNDKFWGVCRGEGLNWLGKILMAVREDLKKSKGIVDVEYKDEYDLPPWD